MHKRVAAADQGLTGDDRRQRAQQDRHRPQCFRKHHIKRIEIFDGLDNRIVLVLDDPDALPHVVQDQADFNKRPAEEDVVPAHMPHIRIQGLRTGGTQEYASQDQKPGFVVGADQNIYGIIGIQGPQNRKIAKGQPNPRQSQKQKPQHHDRPEHFANGTGPASLNHKQSADDRQRDHYHKVLPAAQHTVHDFDASQTFHGRRDGHRGGKDTVGQHGTAADHGGDDQPFPAVTDQAVKRKDAAFAVIVGPQRNQHMLDRRQQCDSPDDQRQGAHNKLRIHIGYSAVAFDDGFHYIHRGCANVTVYNTECYKEHPKTEFMAVFSLILLHIFLLKKESLFISN